MTTTTPTPQTWRRRRQQAPDDADPARVHAWWRAANYLSVGQIYLLDNPLLRTPLEGEHIKPRLLGHWVEWDAAKGLLPIDAQWYCPDGTEGVSEDRVIAFEGDLMLGDSVALVHTPGHTMGNHSIVVHTDEGLFVTSENGVAPESYAPQHSRIAGVRKWAKTTGAEVVLNGNTLESATEQSMVQEKEIAGPSRRNPDFPNMACSSELSSHVLSPGVGPTFHLGEVSFGAPVARVNSGTQQSAAE